MKTRYIILLICIIVYCIYRISFFIKERSIPKDVIENITEMKNHSDSIEFEKFIFSSTMEYIAKHKYAVATFIYNEYEFNNPKFKLISLLSQVLSKNINRDTLKNALFNLENNITKPTPYQEYLFGRLYYLLGRNYEGYSKTITNMALSKSSKNPFFLKSIIHYQQAFYLTNDPYPLVEASMVFDYALNNLDSAKAYYKNVINGFYEGNTRFSCYLQYYSTENELLVTRGIIEDVCKSRLFIIYSDEKNFNERDKFSINGGGEVYQSSIKMYSTIWLDSNTTLWRPDIITSCNWIN